MRRLTSFLSLFALMPALVISAPGTAVAGHDGSPDRDDVPSLVAAVAEANQRMADVGSDIQIKQEGVNRALVEIAAARDTLAQARRDVVASDQALTDSQHAIEAAQQRFDRFAASTYMNGPSGALPLAQSPEEILAGASTQQTLTISFQRSATTSCVGRPIRPTSFLLRRQRGRAPRAPPQTPNAGKTTR
jgi:septal ring factor EnvC (AmiA/AmiB activator)